MKMNIKTMDIDKINNIVREALNIGDWKHASHIGGRNEYGDPIFNVDESLSRLTDLRREHNKKLNKIEIAINVLKDYKSG